MEQKCKKRLNLMHEVAGSTWAANKKTVFIIYKTLNSVNNSLQFCTRH